MSDKCPINNFSLWFLEHRNANFVCKKITNREYQEINSTSDRTASRDLENLVALNILNRIGEKKRVYYQLKIGEYGG